MSIYKPNKGAGIKKKAPESSSNVVLDDDLTFGDDETFADKEYLTGDGDATVTMRPKLSRRQNNVLLWFIVVLVLSFIALSVLGIFFFLRSPSTKKKPLIELCRIHYHEWKTSSTGTDKKFLLEGEYYQQVEIDYIDKVYEKLSVPSVLNSKTATILHDFNERLTTIVDRDNARCMIMTMNSTFVKPLEDFYEIVLNIKAGYDAPDAEVIRDTYRLLLPEINDVSQFGPHIYSSCQYFDTYRVVRDDEPLSMSKRSACFFEGNQYCLGNAGTEYMGLVIISECIQQ